MPRSDRIRASAPTLICSSRISWHDCGARIDFDRRRVGVRRAFSDVGGRVVLGTPKSHQSRTVPLPRFLAAEFAAAVVGKDADQLVFSMPGGGVMRMPNWRRSVFLSARRRASLSDRLRVHDLRHTAASLMIQAGYPPKMLQEIMGHASITTTLDLYGNPRELHQTGAFALVAW
jgi:integrase